MFLLLVVMSAVGEEALWGVAVCLVASLVPWPLGAIQTTTKILDTETETERFHPIMEMTTMDDVRSKIDTVMSRDYAAKVVGFEIQRDERA